MKNLKRIQNNNGGFSLVELIVVIVIMLVLAAVLVPNISKYIGMAGQANTKNDASTLLTQVQAEVAETVAKALQNKKTPGGTEYPYPHVILGKVDAFYKGTKAEVKFSEAAFTANQETTDGSGSYAWYHVDSKYQVDAFCYRDGGNFINWTAKDGWEEVGPTESPAAGN